jgi:hypothetical protein
MRYPSASLLLTLSLSLLPSLACDAEPEDDYLGYTSGTSGTYSPPVRLRPGATWGPCDLTDVSEPGWWGCDGSLGVSDACLRPVSNNNLTVCVPQTYDADVDDDCGNVVAPFGLGVRLQGSAYCVADCETDADCGPGRACSPASHFCAWIGT